MFIGRKKELSVLEDTYKKPGFQMTVVYGRRRIGQTRFSYDRLIILNLPSLFRKEVYEALMDRRGLIDKRYEEVEFLFSSLSGFSKWVKENAHPDRVRLVTMEELYD